ncbi:uncharacterized protein FYW23_015376 [Sylvia borin]
MLEAISRNRKAVPPSLQQRRAAQEEQSDVSSVEQQPAASQQQAGPVSPSGDVGGESQQLPQIRFHLEVRSPPSLTPRQTPSPSLPPPEQGQTQQGGGGVSQTPEQGKQPQIASAAGDNTAAQGREGDAGQLRPEHSHGGDAEPDGGRREDTSCEGGADHEEKQLAGDRRDFADREIGTKEEKPTPAARRRVMRKLREVKWTKLRPQRKAWAERERAAQTQAQSRALQTPEAPAAQVGAGAVAVGCISSRSLAPGGFMRRLMNKAAKEVFLVRTGEEEVSPGRSCENQRLY